MSLSVRTRFEVFKRDRFTCAYCGHTPPEVLLEVDHIVPRAAGGSDDLTNLVTSCQDCNRGKADRLLEEGTRPAMSMSVDEMRERTAQAESYAEMVDQLERVSDRLYQLWLEHWADAFGAKLEEREDGTYFVFGGRGWGKWPNERSVRHFLRVLDFSTVVMATDVTAARFSHSNDAACRYFYAICWRRIREDG